MTETPAMCRVTVHTLTGKTQGPFSLVEKSPTFIADLKTKINDSTGTPMGQMRLFFAVPPSGDEAGEDAAGGVAPAVSAKQIKAWSSQWPAAMLELPLRKARSGQTIADLKLGEGDEGVTDLQLPEVRAYTVWLLLALGEVDENDDDDIKPHNLVQAKLKENTAALREQVAANDKKGGGCCVLS